MTDELQVVKRLVKSGVRTKPPRSSDGVYVAMERSMDGVNQI